MLTLALAPQVLTVPGAVMLSATVSRGEEILHIFSVAIQVLPKVAANEETIRIVDEAIAYIKSFHLRTEVGPFETTIEGDYDTLMEIVKGCSKVCIDAGAPDVMTYVKINLDPTSLLTMDLKTAKRILSGTRLSDGFNDLKAKNALKLSLEALVIDKRFTALFTDEEANEALTRLLEAGHRF